MTRPLRVVLAGGMAVSAEHVLRSHLGDAAEFICIPGYAAGEVAEAVATADAMVGPRFHAPMAERGVAIRLFHLTGAGTEKVDLTALPAATTVCNVYAHSVAMAEYAVMAMLALARQLVPMDRSLRVGSWVLGGSYGNYFGAELHGKSLCIVGAGEAARHLINLGSALGMQVTVVRRQARPDDGRCQGVAVWERNRLADALRQADCVVVAVPLTNETRGIIGPSEIALLKPTAILVNMARSQVVDEGALFGALKSGRLGGAAIDVWSRSPAEVSERVLPSPYPFHELDNVVLTPHVAGATRETITRRFQIIAANLRRLMDGQPLVNVVGTGRATI